MITLGELKQRVYKIIEEYSDSSTFTDDEDYSNKFTECANTVMNEIDQIMCKAVKDEAKVTEGEEIDLSEELDRFRLLKKITGVKYEIVDNLVTFKESGTATFYYYQLPKQITSETEDDFKIRFNGLAVDALIYGIASDILKNDVSTNYGAYFTQRYTELKGELDPRGAEGIFTLYGGLNI